nr:hypothetical protein [Tanacetum cinerariifolium]
MNITRSPSPKASIFPQKVTAVKAPMINAAMEYLGIRVTIPEHSGIEAREDVATLTGVFGCCYFELFGDDGVAGSRQRESSMFILKGFCIVNRTYGDLYSMVCKAELLENLYTCFLGNVKDATMGPVSHKAKMAKDAVERITFYKNSWRPIQFAFQIWSTKLNLNPRKLRISYVIGLNVSLLADHWPLRIILSMLHGVGNSFEVFMTKLSMRRFLNLTLFIKGGSMSSEGNWETKTGPDKVPSMTCRDEWQLSYASTIEVLGKKITYISQNLQHEQGPGHSNTVEYTYSDESDEDKPLEAEKSEIDPLIRESSYTFLMRDKKITLNPLEDCDEHVPIPRVSEKTLDSFDLIFRNF